MTLLRLLLAVVTTTVGLLVSTQLPAAACDCATAEPAQSVAGADLVFEGTLLSREDVSGERVGYGFGVEETFAGDARDGVVESYPYGAGCGLEGMEVGQVYVVFATRGPHDVAEANLCGGTARATPALVAAVETAVDAETAAPARSGVLPGDTPSKPPVPTEVPSGLGQPERVVEEGALPSWAWFGAGVLLALVGGCVRVSRAA